MEVNDLISRTIVNMEGNQKKKKEVIEYMETNKPYLLGKTYKKGRIRECCNVLRFRNYKNGIQKLYHSNFCKYDKLCLACAIRRSIKMIKRFLDGIEKYDLYQKHWYHITLTIRHNKTEKLETVLNKLYSYKDKLGKNYRNGKRVEQKSKSFMNNFDGIVSSIQVSRNETNGWHPYIHILACSDNEIPIEFLKSGGCYINKDLQSERCNITGGSNMISIRKVTVNKAYIDKKGIGEVFKYATRFAKLDVEHLVELIELQTIKKYHFFSTYGIFRGWDLDGKDEDDENFIEKTFVYFEDEYTEALEETVETDSIDMRKEKTIASVLDDIGVITL